MSEARYMQEKYSEKIEELEEELEYLKAEATFAEYTICNNIEGYPDYIVDAARTIQQYVDRKIETFEEALQDARDAYKRWHDRVLTED
jgi:hypothetical protein